MTSLNELKIRKERLLRGERAIPERRIWRVKKAEKEPELPLTQSTVHRKRSLS